MVKLQLKQLKSIISFTLKSTGEQAISREQIQKIFTKHRVNLVNVDDGDSRPSHGTIFNIECLSDNENLLALENEFEKHCEKFTVRPRYFVDGNQITPWFPRTKTELFKYCNYITGYSEVGFDHPGFSDTVYCERRKYIVGKTMKHKPHLPLPYINYTAEETETWSKVFTKLTKLYQTHACREYNANFDHFVENGIFNAFEIPQLEELSQFLKKKTGFTLYPVGGFLSPRDFLAALAFRVFRSTQYIRHSSEPIFTPEPDVCHELLGHTPMFADESFARFSQEIGLASLGASDEFIEKLAACYWFSIEFGLCRQDGKLKAYGAGLLSSYGELEYCLSEKPELRQFQPRDAAEQPYKLTDYQLIYYVAESFTNATEKVKEYALTIPRGFKVMFNQETDQIEAF